MASFTLMNKDVPVLAFEYDLEAHFVTRITAVHNAAWAPPGLFDERGNVSKRDLNYWWRHRAIPASREQIERVLDNLQLDSTLELAERSFGLSLTDRYWIDDDSAPQRWDDINFFDNAFSEDLGILTLGQDSGSGVTSSDLPDYARVNLTSPNSTLGGDLRKKWKIVDGARVLVKSGVGVFNQEPYNEVVATALYRRLLAPGDFVEYRLLTEGRRVYSACDNMLGPDEELISAYDLIRKRKQRNNESDLMFYVRCCAEAGVGSADDVMDGLAKMFACDYVLANRDRHWRNFGIVRNCVTLGGARLAPIFDTGASLWSDMLALELPIDFKYTAKPFKYDGMPPYKQLTLFQRNLGWLDEGALDGFVDELRDILAGNPNMPERRLESIARQVAKNIETLRAVAHQGG